MTSVGSKILTHSGLSRVGRIKITNPGLKVGSEQLENFTVKPVEVNWTQQFPGLIIIVIFIVIIIVNEYLDDGLCGYYIFGEVIESTGFEYPNVSIVITNDSDDQSVVTPSGTSLTFSRNSEI